MLYCLLLLLNSELANFVRSSLILATINQSQQNWLNVQKLTIVLWMHRVTHLDFLEWWPQMSPTLSTPTHLDFLMWWLQMFPTLFTPKRLTSHTYASIRSICRLNKFIRTNNHQPIRNHWGHYHQFKSIEFRSDQQSLKMGLLAREVNILPNYYIYVGVECGDDTYMNSKIFLLLSAYAIDTSFDIFFKLTTNFTHACPSKRQFITNQQHAECLQLSCWSTLHPIFIRQHTNWYCTTTIQTV